MLKFLSTIITGVIVGALGVYFTLDWQEEKLVYSISAPAKFGEINYQNITLKNTGWNPAININVHISHPNITFKNVQSKTTLKDLSSDTDGIASIERVRRDEAVVISLAYEGQPLFGTEIKISSDRSIATLIEGSNEDLMSSILDLVFKIFGGLFLIGTISAVTLPAYKNYKDAAKKAALDNAK